MKRIVWIDCAKFIAILVVVIDHSYRILYENNAISLFSFFSVNLFVILMGITTYIAEEKNLDTNVGTRIKRRMGRIFWPYFIATFVYSVAKDHMFDFKTFVLRLIYFDASAPFYYVFLYMQLIFANLFIYKILRVCDKGNYAWIKKIFVGMGIGSVSWLTTRYTNMLDIYGGGGKLFGGTYLFLAYIGMIVAPYMLKNVMSMRRRLLLFAGTSAMWLLWYRFINRDYFRLDSFLLLEGVNPPGPTLMIYAGIVLVWCSALFSMDDAMNHLWVRKLIAWVQCIGKNSLYIFLYHKLILDYFLCPYVIIENIWLKRVFYLLCMIGIPILGNQLYGKLKQAVLSDKAASTA